MYLLCGTIPYIDRAHILHSMTRADIYQFYYWYNIYINPHARIQHISVYLLAHIVTQTPFLITFQKITKKNTNTQSAESEWEKHNETRQLKAHTYILKRGAGRTLFTRALYPPSPELFETFFFSVSCLPIIRLRFLSSSLYGSDKTNNFQVVFCTQFWTLASLSLTLSHSHSVRIFYFVLSSRGKPSFSEMETRATNNLLLLNIFFAFHMENPFGLWLPITDDKKYANAFASYLRYVCVCVCAHL